MNNTEKASAKIGGAENVLSLSLLYNGSAGASIMILDYILDFLFPKKCAGCGADGTFFCQKCQKEIEYLDEPFVKISCGKDLKNVIAVAKFKGTIREAVHAFKYEGVRELAEDFSEIVVRHFEIAYCEFIKERVLVPVPLYRSRFLERGFNQSALLAEKIALKMNLKYRDLLIKKRTTPAQMSLGAKERKINLEEVFGVLDKDSVNGKRVLLVDDVLTTGSTLCECAKVLTRVGAKDVLGLVLARD